MLLTLESKAQECIKTYISASSVRRKFRVSVVMSFVFVTKNRDMAQQRKWRNRTLSVEQACCIAEATRPWGLNWPIPASHRLSELNRKLWPKPRTGQWRHGRG